MQSNSSVLFVTACSSLLSAVNAWFETTNVYSNNAGNWIILVLILDLGVASTLNRQLWCTPVYDCIALDHGFTYFVSVVLDSLCWWKKQYSSVKFMPNQSLFVKKQFVNFVQFVIEKTNGSYNRSRLGCSLVRVLDVFAFAFNKNSVYTSVVSNEYKLQAFP